MLEKVKQLTTLMQEIKREYPDVISIDDYGIQIYKPDFLLNLSQGKEYVRKRSCYEYPVELVFETSGTELYTLLSDNQYEEYKKSRASDTTKQRKDLIIWYHIM